MNKTETNNTYFKHKILFACISILYVFVRWQIFNGFNGSDDLHYAFLSSKLLQHTYSPFIETDIFSGRILLIVWQAFMFKLFGINGFATQAGTIVATILSAYLVVFKLIDKKNIHAKSIILLSSLFYFNPVLTEATIGTLPDVYVMLGGIVIMLLLNKILVEENYTKIFVQSTLIAITIFTALLFKETAIIYLPFVLIVCFLNKNRQTIFAASVVLSMVLAFIALLGLVYYFNTNNFFFKLIQIENSSYPNVCNYNFQDKKAFAERLTFGVFKQFFVENFLPVLLAFTALIYNVLKKEKSSFNKSYSTYFVVLLLLGLYFPFSLKSYQPLCFKARHFLFLLPIATINSYCFLFNLNNKKAKNITVIICLIVYTKVLYHNFHYKSNWYNSLKEMSSKLNGNTFYFPEQDNMMHFKLFKQFDSSIHCYNLDANAFKVFKTYYDTLTPNNFKQGWLIINTKYSERNKQFFTTIDQLQQQKYFDSCVTINCVKAFRINSFRKIELVKSVMK